AGFGVEFDAIADLRGVGADRLACNRFPVVTATLESGFLKDVAHGVEVLAIEKQAIFSGLMVGFEKPQRSIGGGVVDCHRETLSSRGGDWAGTGDRFSPYE